jgi:PAS domain S-box-containing protein
VTPLFGLFAVAMVEIGLAVLVWSRGRSRAVNRWFAVFATTIATWAALLATRRMLQDPAAILVTVRAIFAVVTLIPVAFYRFTAVFPRPEPQSPALAQLVTFTGLFISGLAFSPWIVSHMRPAVVGRFPDPSYGPLYSVFVAYFVVCMLWALVTLARKRRTATGFARAQLHYLFLGTALAVLGAVTTNLLVPVVFRTSRLSVYGPYFTLIWLAFAAHSIIRHRLMDVRVFVSRTVAYGSTWALVSVIVVGGGIVVSSRVLGDPDLSPITAVLLGLAASLGFVALAPRTKRLADRYLYRPAYDASALVREGSRAMGTFADPAQVARAMAQILDRALHLESIAIVVWARERGAFQAVHASHVDPAFPWPAGGLAAAAPLAREIRERSTALLRDELATRPGGQDLATVAAELKAWNADIAVPVRDGALMAMVLVGPKLSGDSFFGEDLDLLETLASELAIGLKNAQLYHEVVSIKEYNERILAYMDSGVIAVRDDRIVTTFNPAAERITGRPAPQTLNRGLDTLDLALQAVLRDSLAGHRDAETEITVSHPEGRIIPLIVHASALHDQRGQIRGAIAVLNDHTRLKALEEDKRRADRLAAMGSMASGIAHEIRNPLVAIKTFAELLPERADDHEFRSTFAKVAVKEIHRIEQLLGRLRALAAPTSFPLRPLDLRVPLGETLDLLRGEADRRRVRLVVEIEPDLPTILGEPDQIKQLVLNLCLNALEAMTGGGTLSLSVRTDRERPDRHLVTVRVTDTGPGIPREDLARVFEPFFTTKASGTGLGLAICRSIADAHRAALWAEPGPAGVGTAFVIQFPAPIAAPAVETLR